MAPYLGGRNKKGGRVLIQAIKTIVIRLHIKILFQLRDDKAERGATGKTGDKLTRLILYI